MSDVQKNMQFCRWTVVRAASSDSHGRARTVVRCKCGTEAIVLENALKRGNTSGCKSVTCRKKWEASQEKPS